MHLKRLLSSTVRTMALAALALAAFLASPGLRAATDTPPAGALYLDRKAPVEDRIADLVPRLTLEEKISMIHGDTSAHTDMDTAPVPRLGIPKLSMSDGPHGVRWGQATAFPPGVTMASTWDDTVMQKMGAALAEETLAKGRNVILGPCVNIHRIPFGGRNFESMSEDPFLAGRIATAYIKGVQSRGVIATIKHLAVNNQEVERGTISAEISERALRELYLSQFEAAVRDSNPWAFMCSYNRINGVYACENDHLLNDILKNEWGYKGIVMSDWGAVHSTVPTALHGMDIEMPNGAFTGSELLKAVRAGEVPESVIDDKVSRILRIMMQSGIFDRTVKVDGNWLDSPEHRAVALEVAREGITLLKNESSALPLDRGKIKTIAVIGPNAREARMGGGGSSSVTPFYSVSPLEGIIKQAGGNIRVKYMQGCDIQLPVDVEPIPPTLLSPPDSPGENGMRGDYFNGRIASGKPVFSRIDAQTSFNWNYADPAPGIRQGDFTARWRAVLTPPKDGEYKFAVMGNGFTKLFIGGKLRINNWPGDGEKRFKSASVKLKAGEPVDIKFEYTATGGASSALLGWSPPGHDSLAEAAKLAKSSDAAIVVAGLDNRFEGEGHDRDNIEIPGLQNELISAVAAANPRTIVVLVNGTPLKMEKWLSKVPALVEAWYPGEEGGRAIAEVLFGDINPSGKLPVTIPASWEQTPAFGNYPGGDGKVNYAEGIFVGYRYYDTKNIKPVFPFGHGLSYTKFEYSGLKITPGKDASATVSLTVRNSGSRAGKEVVQLYVRDVKSSVERPLRELKAFKKIELAPGKSTTITFKLDNRAFSFYSEAEKRWVAEPGQFEIAVGSSSRDLRLKGIFNLGK